MNKTNNTDDKVESRNEKPEMGYEDYMRGFSAPTPQTQPKFSCLLKALFIKFWFAGAVFYFVGWGLSFASSDQLDLVFALGLVIGLVTDYLVNPIFRNMGTGGYEYRPYMLFRIKKWWTVFVSVPYSIILAAAVAYSYHGLNLLIASWQGKPEGVVALGAEPLLYGLLYLLFDMIVLVIRNAIEKAIQKRKTAEEVNV